MRTSLNLASLGLLRQGVGRAINTATDGLIRLSEGDQQQTAVIGAGATFYSPPSPEIEGLEPKRKSLIEINNEALILLMMG